VVGGFSTPEGLLANEDETFPVKDESFHVFHISLLQKISFAILFRIL